MTQYQDKPGDFALFIERDKKNEKGPDRTGYLIVPEDVKPGDRIRLAAWERKNDVLSGKAEKERSKQGGQQRSAPPQQREDYRRDDLEDSIPFD